MPHIVIYNLTETDRKHIEEIEEALNTVIISLKELNLSEKDISYTFVQDDSVKSEKTPVVIIVELLAESKKRSFMVREKMAKSIARTFFHVVEEWRTDIPELIEVAVKRFDPDKDAMWAIKTT